MNAHDTYVSDSTYEKLKKVGFDWDYWDRLFNMFAKRPQVSLSVAQRWLREYTDGHVVVMPSTPSGSYFYIIYARVQDRETLGYYFKQVCSGGLANDFTYEDALEKGINRALDIMLEGGKQ